MRQWVKAWLCQLLLWFKHIFISQFREQPYGYINSSCSFLDWRGLWQGEPSLERWGQQLRWQHRHRGQHRGACCTRVSMRWILIMFSQLMSISDSTVRCHYNVLNFLQSPQKRHPIMGCLFCVQTQIHGQSPCRSFYRNSLYSSFFPVLRPLRVWSVNMLAPPTNPPPLLPLRVRHRAWRVRHLPSALMTSSTNTSPAKHQRPSLRNTPNRLNPSRPLITVSGGGNFI